MLDKDIREPLFDYLDERYGRVRTIEEKVISKSRADVLAIIDGLIIGFEIKSDADTYTRLKTQIKDYEKFCDLCYVVVGESHKHVSEHIPDYWGIIFVNEDNVIVERDASICPKISIYNQLDILWRNELLNIQLKNGLPKLAGTKRRIIYDRLLDTIGEKMVKYDLTQELFERDYTIFDKTKPSVKTSITSKKYVSTKNGVKVKSSRKRRTTSGDKKRAHVTNYVGKRSSKSKKK